MLVSLRRAQGGGGLEYCRGKSRRVAQNRGNVSLYLYISLQHLQKSPKISTRFSDYETYPRHKVYALAERTAAYPLVAAYLKTSKTFYNTLIEDGAWA